MQSSVVSSRSRRIGGWLVLSLAAALSLPSALHAHIRLESSSPARDEVLSAPPALLRLLFSARIEARYTSLELIAPDGSTVVHGGIEFTEGSDREFTALLPPLQQAGTYTVRWRTAGADGHVLEGSFAFALAPEAVAVTEAMQEPAPADATTAQVATHDDHHEHEETASSGGLRGVIARGLQFAALLGIIGALAFRVLLLPKLEVMPDTRRALVLRVWRTVAVAAILLAVAALLRLWVQSIALHGTERAWSTPLLSIMLRDTSWGRAWVVQALLFAILGMAIVWAGPLRDRTALAVAIPTAIGLAAIPALTGHAASAGNVQLAVMNDTAHVVAAGAWLGMLAVLMIAVMPVLRRREPPSTGVAAVDRFSPIALVAAAFVVLTGAVNSIIHVGSLANLWTTEYGNTLIWKLALVGLVFAAGFINWRIVRPRLRQAGDARQLQASATGELIFAALVLAATAVLTGRPHP